MTAEARNARAITVIVGLLILSLTAPAAADDAGAIRDRLQTWTSDFNAGRAEDVCDLFSREAISDYRGQPQRNYDEICALLKRSLADPNRQFRYQLDLRETILAGDLAVVRLVWTLVVSPGNLASTEPGMDIFRREADGKWRIIRYIAYEAP